MKYIRRLCRRMAQGTSYPLGCLSLLWFEPLWPLASSIPTSCLSTARLRTFGCSSCGVGGVLSIRRRTSSLVGFSAISPKTRFRILFTSRANADCETAVISFSCGRNRHYRRNRFDQVKGRESTRNPSPWLATRSIQNGVTVARCNSGRTPSRRVP